MPGLVVAIRGSEVRGCAWHPHFQSYHVLVHVVAGRQIVASVVADENFAAAAMPAAGIGHGFTVDLGAFDIADSRLLIGETDEWFEPAEAPDRTGAEITLEEIIGVRRRRDWVSGKIYFDALLAGLSIETIVDLYFRDCLDRPADSGGLAHYSRRIRAGSLSFEALRAILVNSQEYKLRWPRADAAPGAIFSQRIVLLAGKELNALCPGGAGEQTCVSRRRVMTLSPIDFVAAAYLDLLGASPDAADLWRHVAELRGGRQRLDIIRELCGRPPALARAFRWSDLVVDREAEPLAAALPVTLQTAAAVDLLRLEGTEFLTESYRRILGRPPSAQEATFLGDRLTRSRGKQEILEYLAADPAALADDLRHREPPRAAAAPGMKSRRRAPVRGGRAASAPRRPATTAAAAGDK